MRILFLLSLCVSLGGCTVYGLTNDYNKLTNTGKSLIQKLENFNYLENKKIYEINAAQLKEELKKHDKSIVYFFTNACTSEFCKLLNVYENYAEKHGYKIFFVMRGYGKLGETLSQEIKSPLFSIDNQYYNTKWSWVYAKRFENELLNRPIKAKAMEYQGNLYFFERYRLVKILQELPNENQLDIFK